MRPVAPAGGRQQRRTAWNNLQAEQPVEKWPVIWPTMSTIGIPLNPDLAEVRGQVKLVDSGFAQLWERGT
jgi:hypothetical protein